MKSFIKWTKKTTVWWWIETNRFELQFDLPQIKKTFLIKLIQEEWAAWDNLLGELIDLCNKRLAENPVMYQKDDKIFKYDWYTFAMYVMELFCDAFQWLTDKDKNVMKVYVDEIKPQKSQPPSTNVDIVQQVIQEQPPQQPQEEQQLQPQEQQETKKRTRKKVEQDFQETDQFASFHNFIKHVK